MYNILHAGVARPRLVLGTGQQWIAYRVHTGDKVAVRAQHVEHLPPHSRHQLHIHHHVRAVSQLDADVRDLRAQRPHRERHNIHRAPPHAARKDWLKNNTHLGRSHPVVGGARVVLPLAADVGAALHTGDVAGMGAREVAVGTFVLVELDQGALCQHLVHQTVVLLLRPVAPADRLRLA